MNEEAVLGVTEPFEALLLRDPIASTCGPTRVGPAVAASVGGATMRAARRAR